MKIIIFGDTHAKFSFFEYCINNMIKAGNEFDAIIVCGDFGYWPRTNVAIEMAKFKTPVPIYFCDGNHEDFDILYEKVSDDVTEIMNNVFYVRRGGVVKFADKNFLFMGGALSIDRNWRVLGQSWFEQELITQTDLDKALSNKEKIDVVISHTCPEMFFYHKVFDLFGGKYDKFNDPSCRALNIILEEKRPDLWFFGHWHIHAEGIVKNTKWCALSNFNNENSSITLEI